MLCMKKCVPGILLFLLTSCSSFNARSQSFETEQLLLNLEKLSQLKSMLEDLKKGYEIISNGYNRVKEVSEGNFNLHDLFLHHLLKASPTVRNYYKVKEITTNGLKLVDECKGAFKYFQQSAEFTTEEINHLKKVYTHLLSKSANYLEDLAVLISDGTFRMSDDERISHIDAIHLQVLDQLTFLKHFNNENKVLLIQRAKAQNDVETSKRLHGLTY